MWKTYSKNIIGPQRWGCRWAGFAHKTSKIAFCAWTLQLCAVWETYSKNIIGPQRWGCCWAGFAQKKKSWKTNQKNIVRPQCVRLQPCKHQRTMPRDEHATASATTVLHQSGSHHSGSLCALLVLCNKFKRMITHSNLTRKLTQHEILLWQRQRQRGMQQHKLIVN